MHDDTTMIRPPRRRRTVWVVVSILAAVMALGGLAGGMSTLRSDSRTLPTNPPSPSVSYKGTWRIIRVPGVQTGIHVPAPQYTTPPARVVTKTVQVPVPGPTVTRTVQVPGPAITVTCTVTAVPPAAPSQAPSTAPSLSAPVCTTEAPTH